MEKRTGHTEASNSSPCSLSALQMSNRSGCRMSLQLMAMLMAVSCLSPVITHTCQNRARPRMLAHIVSHNVPTILEYQKAPLVSLQPVHVLKLCFGWYHSIGTGIM